ncbi:LacI family DNA-binding transcriptional regulator [Pelagicoccus mobilis]|uniref:LacI family DNA-binding transcriptional regulator n=1 Tax=Pelagicoccus mobilis TaxID=415221 RepID=A0A934S189_9BACT|nr:LacI family DNA-binding transcriptional regulator [Pelagicoccus mobilis]MBK1877248.1 LacI family DNA-binding transcriptional regulator [Pelagicoccus mobilis]
MAKSNQRGKAATMADLAEKTGFAKSTVSLALRDHPSVAEETKDAIKRAAEELNYEIPPLIAAHMAHVRGLKEERFHGTLGFLTTLKEGRELNASAPFKAYLKGARDTAQKLGYNLDYFHVETDGSNRERLDRILLARGVLGVILTTPDPTAEIAPKLDHLATSIIGYTFSNYSFPRAACDNYSICEGLINRLKRMGFRKIGYVSKLDADQRGRNLARASFLVHNENTKKSDRIPPFIEKAPPTHEFDKKKLKGWIDRYQPEVLITAFGLEVKTVLNNLGLQIPNDIQLATYCWKNDSSDISGYYQNYEKIGASAVHLLIGQMHRNEKGPSDTPPSLLVGGEWREGKTLKVAAAVPAAILKKSAR